MKFNFIKSGKIFFAITLTALLAAVVCFFVRGFNMDIEFVGGTELTFALDENQKPDEEAIKTEVEKLIGKDLSNVRTVNGNEFVVRTTLIDKEIDYSDINTKIEAAVKELYNGAFEFSAYEGKVTFKIEKEQEDEDVSANVEAVLTEDNRFADLVSVGVNEWDEGEIEIAYTVDSEVNTKRAEIEETVNKLYPMPDGKEGTRLIGTSTVSPEVSDSLKRSAVLATTIAIALMLLYIAIRFEGRAAVAAVVCLAHDVVMMLFAYSVFQIPVSSTVIAAILTILGYSINATIVVFDRIRENNKYMPERTSFEDKADLGVKSTLWRSLNTTITTLITIGLVYILGVTSIKNFALPLIVGIIAGVYSSVCLSANVWVALKKIGNKKTK